MRNRIGNALWIGECSVQNIGHDSTGPTILLTRNRCALFDRNPIFTHGLFQFVGLAQQNITLKDSYAIDNGMIQFLTTESRGLP